MVNKEKQLMGKKSRAAGKRFELKVRKDLESQGWIVLRNTNDLIENKFVIAKSAWNPYTRMPTSLQSGFPDFLCLSTDRKPFFVESKMTGYLDKKEKDKVKWIKKNLKLEVLLASKGEKRGEIFYEFQ